MKSQFTLTGLPLLAVALLGLTGCSRSADLAPTALNPANLKLVADAPATDNWGAQPDQAMIAHSFVYKTDKKLESVALVGSFNNWDKTKNPLKADADGLSWRLGLPLAPGRYNYKFAPFTTDGEETWIADPNAPVDPLDAASGNSLLQIVDQPFRYKANKNLTDVSLVGSFNNWDKTANPMVKEADGLTWTLHLPLAPGRYVYKFAPFDAKGEQTWIVDPNAPRDETDKVNENSVVTVSAPAAALDAATSPDTTTHEFAFVPTIAVKSVSVVGTFNGWDKTANPMKLDADGKTWRASVPLKYGRTVYKFVQFTPENDEKWVVDPNAPLDETDKVNDNSVLVVTPAGYETPASPTDGTTAADALLHPHGLRDLSYDNGKLTLTLRARPNDLRQIQVKSAGQSYPMKLRGSNEMFAYYSADISWDKKKDLNYNFELSDGDTIREFGANGLQVPDKPFVITAKDYRPYLLTEAPAPLKMNGPLTTQVVSGPEWAKNLSIYEVNLDLYKFPKGQALTEFEKHLPSLKEMGVGIVWFMPLHPRGYEKGYGSAYAVRDYTEINPDLGTKADFKKLVARAHQLGLRVLMDWVPNHTSWDNVLIKTHPEYYVKNGAGEITQAYNWPDVAQLNYGKPGAWNQPLWNMMRDNMALWVRDYDVDGFRADVAGSNGKVPIEFWQWLRPQLMKIKPVFMLAEADNPGIHAAFDMSYDFAMPPILWDITAGRKPATAIDEQLRREARDYPVGSILMRFVDNHDWHNHADWGWGNGTPVEVKPGMPQVAPLMVLNATLPGKPLLYNGQELSFAKTDPPPVATSRAQSAVYPFYKNLLELYQNNPALTSGSFAKIATDNDDKVYAFMRQSGANRVLVVVNLSEQAQNVTLKNAAVAGQYRDAFSDGKLSLTASPTMKLTPFGYRVLVK